MLALYIILGIIAFIVIMLHFSVRAHIKASRSGVDVKVKYLWFDIYPRTPKEKKKPKAKKAPPQEEKAEASPPDIPIEELLKMDVEEVPPDSESEKAEELSEVQEAEDKAEEKIEEAHEKYTEFEQANEEEHEEDNDEEDSDLFGLDDDDDEKDVHKDEPSRLEKLKNKYTKIKPYIPMGWKYSKKLLKTIRLTDVDIQAKVGREDAYDAAMFYGKIQGAFFSLLGMVAGMFTVSIKRADIECIFNEKVIDGRAELDVKVRPSAVIAIAVCVGVNFLRIWLPAKIRNRKAVKA